MISLIEFRKDKLIENRKVFKSEKDVENHISFIKKEISITDRKKRMVELKNWLEQIS